MQGEGFARDQAQQPGGRGGTGIPFPTDTDTHSHRPTPGWLRVASARAPHAARRCGGHLPSARDRISDTVLRMVGIAAAAAGGSLNQTLHLSRRRAGGVSGFPAPSAQQARGPCRPPRAAPLPREALAHLRKEEETTTVALSAEPSEICPQPRRGRLGEGRSSGPSAGAGGGVVGARAQSLPRRRGGEGGRGARGERAEPPVAPPRFGLYHLRGGQTGELLAYSTPGALFPPRDFGSSCPSSIAFRFFQAWAKEKGRAGSFILANHLPPPSGFNNSGVARGPESGVGSESAGERLNGRKGLGARG